MLNILIEGPNTLASSISESSLKMIKESILDIRVNAEDNQREHPRYPIQR